MKIFYLMGGARTGKDTFVEEMNKYIPSAQISTVDKVKEIAKECFGWDGVKDDKGRTLLSDLKDAWDNYNNGTIKEVEKFIEKEKNSSTELVFIQVREYKSIMDMKELFGGEVIMIIRPSKEAVEFTVESKFLNEYPDHWEADYEIYNFGTLDEYKIKIKDFATYLKDLKKSANLDYISHIDPDYNIQVKYQHLSFKEFFPDADYSKQIFYLAGCVREIEYRKKMKEYEFNRNIGILDPLDSDYKKLLSFSDIITKDLNMISYSDCLVAYLDEYTAGTMMEMALAAAKIIPVFLIINNPKMLKDVWIIGMASKVFRSIEEFCEWVDK